MDKSSLDYINKLLRNVGLDSVEANAYLTILQYGILTVSLIAQKTKNKRTNTYNIMERLVSIGLATQSNKGNVMMYSAVEPEKVLFILQQRKQKLESNIESFTEILPQLKGLQNPLALKPKVAFYQGQHGLGELLNLALNSGDFIAYFDLQTSYEMFPEVIDDFVNNINRFKPSIREIIVQSREVKPYVKRIQNANYRYKVFPKTTKFHSDHIVFGNFVALLSYREGFTGVLIESHDIAQAQKAIFELLWGNLK